jgi:hypothetical protein
MFEYWIKTDVSQLPIVNHLQGRWFSQDSGANRIGVEVTENGEPLTLSGTVSVNVVKPDGSTITVNGSKTANKAWVDLPSGAYSVVGKIGVFIKITNGADVTTLGGIEAYVYPV